MKKSLLSIALALISCLGFCQDIEQAPTFDAENSVVVDKLALRGRITDNVRLVNMTEETDVIVQVYFYDDKSEEWKIYGVGKVSFFYDTDYVDSPMEDKLKKIRYFAVVSPNGKAYEYSFEERRSDLYVYIYPPKK